MPALHQTSIKETKRDQRDQKQHTRKVTEFHQGFWVETGDRTQVVQAKQSRLGATKFAIKNQDSLHKTSLLNSNTTFQNLKTSQVLFEPKHSKDV